MSDWARRLAPIASLGLPVLFCALAAICVLFIATSISVYSGIALTIIACTAIGVSYRVVRMSSAFAAHPGRGLLSACLNATKVAIVAFDNSGRIVKANMAAKKLMNCTNPGFHSTNIEMFVRLSDGQEVGSVVHHLTRVARQSDAPSIEGSFLPVARAELPVEIHVGAVKVGLRPLWVATIKDLSERKIADAQRTELAARLARANAELDQFAYVASHDLKAPLRVIDNTSQWLAEDLTPHLNDDTRETLGMLRGRVQRMERLLNSLLEHSRVGRVKPDAEIVKGDVIAKVVSRCLAPSECFTIEFEPNFLSAKMPKEPLTTVIHHLVDNAIRHHDRKLGKVRVSHHADETTMTILVADDGPGIPREYHAKVFEVFQTLTRRDERDSSGMGLAIAQKHAQVHGGQISIQDGATRGTTMRVDWPLPALGEKVQELVS